MLSSDQPQAEPPPQVRFILLLPTVHEKLAAKMANDPETAVVFKKNELFDDDIDPADVGKSTKWVSDEFNISRESLFKILTAYDIAPAACSHIRGQEQIFGSRVTKNESNEIEAFGK